MAISFSDSPRHLFRELDRRVSGPVEISLFWSRSADSLVVCVTDASTGESFELPVAHDEAREVFDHPFAYADRAQNRVKVPWLRP